MRDRAEGGAARGRELGGMVAQVGAAGYLSLLSPQPTTGAYIPSRLQISSVSADWFIE